MAPIQKALAPSSPNPKCLVPCLRSQVAGVQVSSQVLAFLHLSFPTSRLTPHDSSQPGRDSSQSGRDFSQTGRDSCQPGRNSSSPGSNSSQQGRTQGVGPRMHICILACLHFTLPLHTSHLTTSASQRKLQPARTRLQPARKRLQLASKRLKLARRNLQPVDNKFEPARKTLLPSRKKLQSAWERLQPARKGHHFTPHTSHSHLTQPHTSFCLTPHTSYLTLHDSS